MKAIIIVFLIGLNFANAQDISSSYAEKKVLSQFYTGLIGKAASLNGSWGLLGGLRAGYNLDENFSIGVAGYGLIPDEIGGSYINQENRTEIRLGYTGVEGAYKYNLSDNFFITGLLLIGAGRVSSEEAGTNDYFFITEPEASINYRITNWFGLGASLGYRLASGVKYAEFSNASFSGWAANVTLNFGF